MYKINIGAGRRWQEDGWEILDNGSGSYDEPWKHRGKCWDTGLADDTYDIVFTSHMLEHIPHFRLEKTVSEFNRIMKMGGTLRILVPSLKKAAEAYVNGDKSFFSGSGHYSDHMGIGASFMRVLISPGQQTLAMSREMDEIFGGYAHLYSFDFEMIKMLLEKWGFDNITESEPGQSDIEEMRSFQHVVHDGKTYDKSDEFVDSKAYLKSGKPWHFGGFDKTSAKQLVVEARKVKIVDYSFNKEYTFHKSARFGGPLEDLKLSIFRKISKVVDGVYTFSQKTRLLGLLRKLRG